MKANNGTVTGDYTKLTTRRLQKKPKMVFFSCYFFRILLPIVTQPTTVGATTIGLFKTN